VAEKVAASGQLDAITLDGDLVSQRLPIRRSKQAGGLLPACLPGLG
jgi:hypothetical protein